MSVSVVSPVFIGRRDELELLAAPVRRAQGGEPAVALIGGEAGVGKTRLVGELAALGSAAGFCVLTGQCIELGAEGLPLAPLVDALRALARMTPAGELGELLGPAGPGLARLLPGLGPVAAAPASGEGLQAGQLLELVLGLLGRLSAVRPVMFVIEDLHSADPSTLDLAAFLVRALRTVPVLLVITYRSDELHRRHPLRPLLSGWERVRSVDHIELRRFGRGEVAAQLAAILDREPSPAVADEVFDRSGGNAYLVEEIAGVVRDGADPGDLPPSLRDVLLSRVDAVGPAAQQLLRAASVAGRVVPDRLLAQVAGMGEGELFTALREAVENHLLLVDHTGHSYAFRHALTRDAAYDDMGRAAAGTAARPGPARRQASLLRAAGGGGAVRVRAQGRPRAPAVPRGDRLRRAGGAIQPGRHRDAWAPRLPGALPDKAGHAGAGRPGRGTHLRLLGA